MKYLNYKKIALSPGRKTLLSLAQKGIEEVSPLSSMSKFVKISKDTLNVNGRPFSIKNKRIFVIGAGKASAAMAMELERILGRERITAGVVISNDKYHRPKKIKLHLADHPLPTIRGIRGAKRILDIKELYHLTKDDLIIALISGGGSALMPYPLPGITLQEKQRVSDILLKSGAHGHEFIKIKKMISGIKGGKLALFFASTPIVALVVSDNIYNDLSVVAAGPLCQDKTKIKEVTSIISKYKMQKHFPNSVKKYLAVGCEKKTRAAKDFKHVYHAIIADNDTLVDGIKNEATGWGLKVYTQGRIEGEAKDVAYKICKTFSAGKAIKTPSLFLYGGETVVTIKKKHGLGGRNQEFVLACLDYIKKNQDSFPRRWTIASVASDGRDYIAESAGAIVDENSLKEIERKKMNITSFLKNHDSYVFLKKINSIIRFNRPTGTNVCDIMMFLFN